MAENFSLSWNIDSLNKAYKHGYMAGVMGTEQSKPPSMSEVILAAWEAGWEDGQEVALQDASIEPVRIAS